MGSILIKNGRVWDGQSFFDADILTSGNTVAAIEPSIGEQADFIYDASGKTVSAGLVDVHMHMKGISPDIFGTGADTCCLPFGVTAAADASGVQGSRALLQSFQIKNVVFVCAELKENCADFKNAEHMLEQYGDKAIGIKVYFDTEMSEVTDIQPLCQVVDFAEKHHLTVMVHSSHSPVPMAELLGVLRKGDILTHAYHGGKNNASEDGFACIRQAKRRGIIIDAGMAGHVHTDFRLFQEAVACDAAPDIISTDLTCLSAFQRGGNYGMTLCMSLARAMGMTEEAVFRAVTSRPAAALSMGKKDGWGILSVGGCADIAVLEESDNVFDFTDSSGNRLSGSTGYRCVLTVSDGKLVYRR